MICNIYLQAESDSRKRKESVDKVCKTLDVTNILKPSTDKNDKKSRLERFNLFHHVIVNEKHKVLFCFIPKVGCSNMKSMIIIFKFFVVTQTKIKRPKPRPVTKDYSLNLDSISLFMANKVFVVVYL